MKVLENKIQFSTNDITFELTNGQILTVYNHQERQYLKEDAYQAIELYCESHHYKNKNFLIDHIEDIVDVFMETQDDTIANSVTWKSAIGDVLHEANN